MTNDAAVKTLIMLRDTYLSMIKTSANKGANEPQNSRMVVERIGRLQIVVETLNFAIATIQKETSK